MAVQRCYSAEQDNVNNVETFCISQKCLILVNKITLYGYCIFGGIYGIWLVVFGFSLHENFISVLVRLVLGPAIGGFCIFFGMPLTPYDYNQTIIEIFIIREFINIAIPFLTILLWGLIFFNIMIRAIAFFITRLKKDELKNQI